MRLALVIHALSAGGAERALSTLANAWAAAGHEVHVLTLAGPHAPFYALSPGIRLRHLDVAGGSASALAALCNNGLRLRRLRAELRGLAPDAAVSFMDRTNVLTLLATRGLGLPVIATEHTVAGHWPIGAAWECLRRLSYPWAAAVVVPTRAGAADFARVAPARYAAIPNPVDVPPGKPRADLPKPLLLGMGRLSPEKGFDVLLAAFATARRRHPDWTLAILGEGPERPALEARAARLGLGGSLLLPGSQADPFPWLRAADVFALTSRFEGFSCALAEALACGTPAVAFDCPFGPAEILEHGRTGLLVPDQDGQALAGALDQLMTDADLRRAMAAEGPGAMARLRPGAVLAAWEELLAAAAGGRPSRG